MLYGWSNSLDSLLPGRDFTIDDIVQHVIKLTASGKRGWDPEKGPLFPWLKYQVMSVMDAWIKGQSGKYEISFEDDVERENEGRKSESIKLDDAQDTGAVTPEEALEIKEKAQKDSEIVDLLFEAVSDDPELVAVVEALYNGCENKPRFLAKELDTYPEDIQNRRKRIQRRIRDLRLSYEKQKTD